MICVDLEQDAIILPSEAEDSLCAVCQRLNFSWTCPFDGPHDSSHFHIGLVKHLLNKSSCPGCRLILSSLGIPSQQLPNQQLPSQHLPNQQLPSQHLPNQQLPIEQKVTIQPGFLTKPGTLENDEVDHEPFGKRRRDFEEAISQESYIEVILHKGRDSSSGSEQVGRILRSEPWHLEHSPASNINATKSDVIESPELYGQTVSPTIDISTIKNWMNVCETKHDRCKSLSPLSSHGNKIRLIDVQEQRIINSMQSERYIALSYVWGPATLAILTEDTLSLYSSKLGLQAANLPQTISDCIKLVQELGERYLWVDSLCVVQDDDSDKLEQLRAMDSVFNSAALVVVAAAGNDAHAGLYGFKDLKRQERQRRETVCGIPYITAQPPLRDVLKKTTWNSRCWTFQEAILARRILFFTENQVYWSCKRGNWREDMIWQISDGFYLNFPHDSFWKFHKTLCRTAKYCEDVMAFTQREIREQSDVIWAFMGILKLHSSRFPEGFIWGHPLERLDATLLWDGCPGNHQRTARVPLTFNNGVQSVQYPSWSWLSTNTAVEFVDTCGDSIISEVTWHKPLLFEDVTSSMTSNGISKIDSHTKAIFSGSKGDATKYGRLQCTAETVELSVTLQVPKAKQQGQSPEELGEYLQRDEGTPQFPLLDDRDEATVNLPSGECAGTLFVPRRFFNGNNQRQGLFILLSSNAQNETDDNCIETLDRVDCGNILHMRACKHIQSYNIMLVEQRGDIVYRLALLKVKKELWQKVKKTRREDLTLG